MVKTLSLGDSIKDFINSNLRSGGSAIILFLIWPFAALIVAFKNHKQAWSKNLFWLFCIFFGYTFVIAQSGGADSDRYAQKFLEFAHNDIKLHDL